MVKINLYISYVVTLLARIGIGYCIGSMFYMIDPQLTVAAILLIFMSLVAEWIFYSNFKVWQEDSDANLLLKLQELKEKQNDKIGQYQEHSEGSGDSSEGTKDGEEG